MIAKIYSVKVTCPCCGELHTQQSKDWFIDRTTPFLVGEGYDFHCGCGQEVEFSFLAQQHGSIVRPMSDLGI
ncbi:hypothetical protein GCM10007906_40480 [Vibrio hyugaensis]|jgi:hypothetical protein|uniref:Uncharacterized protein n=2 Tax=Vibrio TaxID=662 RepID=A0AAU9QIS4_9VIBR|nr:MULTISPECIES: hypothetical protein [Vibrio]MCF6452892.1 hypothetical protein [Vibrio sp. MMG023]MCX2790640.1 hypothetical protein [Vibrio sp. Sgm 5]NOJ19817.1 hypothetical protein [Vibrio jasicida]PAW09770.1 hypothetical protein B6K85_15665 [Vibrio sp. V1B]UQA52595.1 hypothetical protein ITG12_22550 [Vibrio sp. ED002]